MQVHIGPWSIFNSFRCKQSAYPASSSTVPSSFRAYLSRRQSLLEDLLVCFLCNGDSGSGYWFPGNLEKTLWLPDLFVPFCAHVDRFWCIQLLVGLLLNRLFTVGRQFLRNQGKWSNTPGASMAMLRPRLQLTKQTFWTFASHDPQYGLAIFL